MDIDLKFIIIHYAGSVTYHSGNFILKNSDSFYQLAEEVFKKSKNTVLTEILSLRSQPTGGRRASVGGQQNTLSHKFKDQMNQLMGFLQESAPRYIRCIKPNS